MNFKKYSNLVLIAGFVLTGCGGSGGGGSSAPGPTAPGPTAPVSINLWTWVSGSNAANQTGVYGSQGSASLTNIPGARDSAISWTDAKGNFWLLGGMGYSGSNIAGFLNDLWRFDGTNWTWVSGSTVTNQTGAYSLTPGVASTTYFPGARQSAVSWIDKGGNLWLFGGYGCDSQGNVGYLNDLWKFDTNKQWTWVSGSNVANQNGVYSTTPGIAATTYSPGARKGAVSWIDKGGNLWLFGGEGFDSSGATPGYLNDLWKYDTNSQWTWVSGNTVVNQIGVSGTQGTAAPGNIPGARLSAVSWIDVSGNSWLFGGYGVALAGTFGDLNDLWKFDSNSQWTWVSGSKDINQAGVYSMTTGSAESTNIPGARENPVSWVDGGGNLWLFGGYGYDTAGTLFYLNDLWKYDGTNWIWMNGSNVANQTGVYGTEGSGAAGNVPGARHLAISWVDGGGNLWLFGGAGYGASGHDGDLNDLWRYQP